MALVAPVQQKLTFMESQMLIRCTFFSLNSNLDTPALFGVLVGQMAF